MIEDFPHATENGYRRHRYLGNHRTARECGCRAAHNLYMAERRRDPAVLLRKAEARWRVSNRVWSFRMHERGARDDFIAQVLNLNLAEVETILAGTAPRRAAAIPRLVVVVERPTKPSPHYYPVGDPARCDSPEDISHYKMVKRNGVVKWIIPE